MALLELKDVTKKFFGFVAVDHVDFKLNRGEILGLIGPNGAGKTTLFNCISGFYKPEEGEIRFKDEDITGLPPHKLAKKGLARTFQLAQYYPNFTVLETLKTGQQFHGEEKLISSFLKRPELMNEEFEFEQKALDILKLVEMEEWKDDKAMNLSGGQRKIVDFATALILEPDMILLDEPTAGVDSVLIEKLLNKIRMLNEELDIAFIVVEHNMKVIMNLCERIIVLNSGQKIADGIPSEIQNNKEVTEVYFGKGR